MECTCKWVEDTQNFILDCFDTICDSPSHIYCSALPLSPSSSWLHQYFSSEVPQGIKVVTGLPAGWGACSYTVSLTHMPLALAYWENSVAVGLESGGIIILNANTRVQTSTLPGHADWVRSLTFSSNGALVVSGSDDKSVKLWNIQVGTPVKTFLGHSCSISSVSISVKGTLVASGSWDCTVRLWDVQTGECQKLMELYTCCVTSVNFSPGFYPYFVSASQDGTIQMWYNDVFQKCPSYKGTHVAFSSTGERFILYGGGVAKLYDHWIWGKPEFQLGNYDLWCCCFSPDGSHVAGAAGNTIYVWDITASEPHLIEKHMGHTSFITSITFSSPSCLISASDDKTVKFWQIGTARTKPVAHSLVAIKSITLHPKKQLAISSDLAGLVKIWNLSTGQLESSFQTEATGKRDVGYLGDRLIMAWYGWKIGVPGKVYAWDVEAGKVLWTSVPFLSGVLDIKISGDGSKVFLLNHKHIQAWSIQTGAPAGMVVLDGQHAQSLIVDGSRVWLSCVNQTTHNPLGQNFIGWDFQTPGSDPTQLSDMPPDKPQFDFIKGARSNHPGSCCIQNIATGRAVFHLPDRFIMHPAMSQWDGQHLVIGYPSGEVFILHFSQHNVESE